MPLKSAESRQKSAEKEGRILLALQEVQNSHIKSVYATPKRYDILPYATLHNRATRMPSHVDKRWHRYRWVQLEEDSLVEWRLSVHSRGAVPRHSNIREIANVLLMVRGIHPPPTVGVD